MKKLKVGELNMNRKEAAELSPIIQAFSEGEPIQYRIKDSESDNWHNVDRDYHRFNPHIFQYRIKSGPIYRPFNNTKECITEMMKHQPFGLITSQCAFFHVIYIEDKLIGYGSACGTILHTKFNDALKSFTFADGLPFGVEEEE